MRPIARQKPDIALRVEQVENIIAHVRLLAGGCEGSLHFTSRGECVLRLGKHESKMDWDLVAKMLSFDSRPTADLLRGKLELKKRRARKR